ncbi:hypothetical protein CCY99_05115 [Helicobacter sp. 16-1353]|nr:hypothetical protein CCY99_05115 [Helicobacter sp. 16-1353]
MKNSVIGIKNSVESSVKVGINRIKNGVKSSANRTESSIKISVESSEKNNAKSRPQTSFKYRL